MHRKSSKKKILSKNNRQNLKKKKLGKKNYL